MDPYARLNNYWDMAQQPASFSTLPDDDFLALLQKQFPTTIGTQPKLFDAAPNAVDPQSISPFSLPNPSPPSSDSSPSPPSAIDVVASSSRPRSASFSSTQPTSPTSPTRDESQEDGRLKRKASDEHMDDEPTHKNPHTHNSSNSLKKSSSSRRKSTGNPQQDEYRLLKRKEQNRAAQRAFRERKEKHVKDLEDKLAEMEAKNQAATSENENLRDLLSRLQQENMALKSGTFDFRVPKSADPPPTTSSFATTPTANDSHTPFVTSSPVASSSKSASVPPEVPGSQFDFNFGQLIPFDPAILNIIDDSQPTATDGAMNMDFGFGPMNGVSHYRTLASDPTSMSFAEPMPYDMGTPQSMSGIDNIGFASFGAWSPPASSETSSMGNHSMDSLDQLFGGNYMGAQSPVDFSALLRSPPSSLSPVSHSHSIRSSSNNSGASAGASASDSPNSTPGATTSSSASPSLGANSATPATPIALSCGGPEGGCPKTREEVKKVIEDMGSSQFVEDGAASAASAGFVKKTADPIMGNMVMCKGSSFPKTEQNEKNIEVLTAWRSITSDPQFKDLDINQLCQEFTSKARCDGTKVVLEPEGVHHIIETLAARRQQLQQKQQSAQSSPASQN